MGLHLALLSSVILTSNKGKGNACMHPKEPFQLNRELYINFMPEGE